MNMTVHWHTLSEDTTWHEGQVKFLEKYKLTVNLAEMLKDINRRLEISISVDPNWF